MSSIQTPTTAQIATNLVAGLNAALGITVQLLPKSFVDVLTKSMAGVFILLWKYGGFIFLQMFVRTATIKEVTINGVTVSPLKEWGRLILSTDPDPLAATQAKLDITITVQTQTGSLPAGTQLTNSGNGVIYLLDAAVALSAPTVTGSVTAVADQSGGDGSGLIGNLIIGDAISFVNPEANVFRDAVVLAVTTIAIDAESTDDYRQRIIDRFQARIQGGAPVDYVVWGGAAALVTNIYPYTWDPATPLGDPGVVNVYVEVSGPDADGIPSNAQLTAVLDDIETTGATGLADRRPANAFTGMFAITRTGFDVEVSGLVVDNPTSVQASITTAIIDFFLAVEPFVAGVTVLPRTDLITQSGLVGIVEDLVTAVGGSFIGVTFKLASGGGNIPAYNVGQGEKAKLDGGVVTFV